MGTPRLTSMDKKPTGGELTPLTPAQIAATLRRMKKRQAARKASPTATTRASAEGTGGVDDPAWGRVGKLFTDGLPG